MNRSCYKWIPVSLAIASVLYLLVSGTEGSSRAVILFVFSNILTGFIRSWIDLVRENNSLKLELERATITPIPISSNPKEEELEELGIELPTKWLN